MSRRLLIAGGLVVALVVTAGLLVRWLVDPETLRPALEEQATDALGQPVTIGRLEWSGLARPRVVLSDVRIGAPAAISVSRVEMTTGLRALLEKRVENAGLVISGSRIQLPLTFVLGSGAPNSQPPADDAGAETAFTIASVDRIALSDIELVAGEAHAMLDLESSLSGDRLAVSRLRRVRRGASSMAAASCPVSPPAQERSRFRPSRSTSTRS